MRHSLKPEYRKYVKGYGFLSFARNFGDKYGKSMISSKNVKKLMDGATKTSKDFAKIAGKKVIHKTAEATGDLVGNEIADKITSISTPRSKKGKITVTDPNSNANFDRRLTLKNNAPFISCISKINDKLVENAEDLGIAMPMHNLLEYSKNYEKTSGSLFNYYRDEPKEHTIGDGDNAINISIRNSESFYYKTKIIRSLATGELEIDDVETAIPLKYLGNFWRSLDIPLINFEITLILSWYKECVLVGRALRNAPNPQPNPSIATTESPTSAKFEITDCKLYVPVVILSAENDNKLLK